MLRLRTSLSWKPRQVRRRRPGASWRHPSLLTSPLLWNVTGVVKLEEGVDGKLDSVVFQPKKDRIGRTDLDVIVTLYTDIVTALKVSIGFIQVLSL